MKSFLNLWSNTVVKYRAIVMLLSVLLTAGAFHPMGNLYFDNSNELFFLPEFLEDPEAVSKVSSLSKYQYMHAEDSVDSV